MRRPDKLRVNADGDLVNKEFFFNGKTITLYDKNDKVYGTVEVPLLNLGRSDGAVDSFMPS